MVTPPPPVPAGIVDVLKDHPALVQRLQESINRAAEVSESSAPRIEMIIWALEDGLEGLVFEALKDVAEAKAKGDTNAVADAESKELLMRRASLKQVWIDDPGLMAYAEQTKRLRN